MRDRSLRIAVAALLTVALTATARPAIAQSLFGSILDRAKREAEARAAAAVDRATRRKPDESRDTAPPVKDRTDPSTPTEEGERIATGYAQYPSFRSF